MNADHVFKILNDIAQQQKTMGIGINEGRVEEKGEGGKISWLIINCGILIGKNIRRWPHLINLLSSWPWPAGVNPPEGRINPLHRIEGGDRLSFYSIKAGNTLSPIVTVALGIIYQSTQKIVNKITGCKSRRSCKAVV